MLAVNQADNFKARLFGPDFRTDKPMPGLDEGDVIQLETPYQAKWGNKVTNAGKRMFNASDLLKERAPNDFPNHYNQTGAPEQMADIEQSAFYAPRQVLNGDHQDMIKQINTQKDIADKAYYDNLGQDQIADAIAQTGMRMSSDTFDAKSKQLMSMGFTEAETQKAMGTLRQEQANIAARRPPVRERTMEESLAEGMAFNNRRNM